MGAAPQRYEIRLPEPIAQTYLPSEDDVGRRLRQCLQRKVNMGRGAIDNCYEVDRLLAQRVAAELRRRAEQLDRTKREAEEQARTLRAVASTIGEDVQRADRAAERA